jgi:hypothetical protein
LNLDTEELFYVAAELASDLAGNDTGRRITKIVAEKLVGPFFQGYQREIIQGDFNEDNLAYGRLLVAIADAWILDLGVDKNWMLPHYETILENLVLVSQSKGYPAEDDHLIPFLLEFWSNFVELALAQQSSDEQVEKKELPIPWESYITRVLEALLKKFEMPPPHEYQTWERQTQVEFRNLRRDFRDLCAATYNLLGPGMLNTLVEYALRLWHEGKWQGVEISLQCIKGIAEVETDPKDGAQAFALLFSSPIFSSGTLKFNDNMPVNVLQTAIELIMDCGTFFQNQSHSLLLVLEYLFKCLKKPELVLPSVKAIAALCDSCRDNLTDHTFILAERYHMFVTTTQQPTEIIEKLAAAVSAVTQSLWSKPGIERNAKQIAATKALDVLLTPIIQGLQTCLADPSPYGQEQGLSALQCLVSISRAFRSPSTDLIDLESEPSEELIDSVPLTWCEERRSYISGLISQVLKRYPDVGDYMEATCNLLRAGMTEDANSPFRPPIDAFSCLLINHIQTTPRIHFLLETVSRFLRRQSAAEKKEIQESRTILAKQCLVASLEALQIFKGITRFAARRIKDILIFP